MSESFFLFEDILAHASFDHGRKAAEKVAAGTWTEDDEVDNVCSTMWVKIFALLLP
jgi:hypothetical protein